MAYASFTDLRNRFDVRVIAKFASDTSVAVPLAALPTNARVTTALQDASGLIMSACVKGKRYSAETLTALAADTDNGALLRQMTCVLAMGALVSSRVAGVDEIDELVHGYKTALDNLNDLRGGGLVFNLPNTLTATLPLATGPSTTDINRPTNWNPMFGRFDYWRF